MSYRDIRNFTEMMQGLGYPRLISMENFRTPNFPLVAEILIWLVKRFDPDSEIPLEISTESERVNLIRLVTQLLVLKANLKLSTKRLYQADGYAVKEMLKITTLLHDSLKTTNLKHKELDDLPEISVVATTMKLQELKDAVQMVGEIVSSGASLFDLLGKEKELREIRNSKAFRHIDMSQVEKAVRNSIEAVSKEIIKSKQSIEDVISNEQSLDNKIEKKKSDIDRHSKRLQTLKKIRPAFMEEFEKLEEELKELYKNYVIKYRNMVFLECVLEQTETAAHKRNDQRQAITRKLIEGIKDEEETLNSGEIRSEGFENVQIEKIKPEYPLDLPKRSTKNIKEQEVKRRMVFGQMTGDGNDSESHDSDSDFLLDGDITVDDDDDDDDDDNVEDDVLPIESQPVKNFSDDDF